MPLEQRDSAVHANHECTVALVSLCHAASSLSPISASSTAA